MNDNYISFHEADTFLSSYYETKNKWGSLSEDDKNDILSSALHIIDAQIYKGCKIEKLQPHQFPRLFVDELTEYSYIVPREIKEAVKWQCVQILTIHDKDGLDLIKLQKVGVEIFEAGTMKIKIDQMKNDLHPYAIQLIRKLLVSNRISKKERA